MSAIRPEFVEFIPQVLVPGVLYISERYRTASHLCACGCDEKVVTPLTPADWQLMRHCESVSLSPSIGNWNYACRSHYWIRRNEIVWSGSMSAARIARVQERDRVDKARQIEQRNQAKFGSAPSPPAKHAASVDATPSWLARAAAWIARQLGVS